MKDTEIIRLLWERSEEAISELEQSYGSYCYRISYQIVQNREDAEECLNDTWFQTWNSIPDKRPMFLKAFVAKIARNLSLNLVIRKNACKRGGGRVQAVLEELEEMLGDEDPIEDMIDRQAFTQRLNRFLEALNPSERNMFVLRFWYLKTPREIAEQFELREKTVYNTLYRLRKQFREYWYGEEM